jgi:Fe-S-cluster-containing dehydrogenase component
MRPDGYIDKCTFCHHRVDQGLDPACVSSCPTHCMHFGVLSDAGSLVSRLLRTRPVTDPTSITCCKGGAWSKKSCLQPASMPKSIPA